MSSFAELVDKDIIAAMPMGMDRMFDAIGPDSMGPIRADRRQGLETAIAAMQPFPGRQENITMPGLDGEPDVPGIFYKRDDALYPEAIFIWLHGGGYVMGEVEDFTVHRYTPLMSVLSVDYRLAPEHRCPAGVMDACAAIEYAAQHADTLGIDPARIIVGGPSGGGGLAAGAVLMNRDRGGPQLMHQWLIYPMIDDTHDTPSGNLDIPDQFWTRDVSLKAWSLYVEEEGASIYAAASRAEDLSGLPPAYIMTGGLDLFRDENIDYAQRLMAQGIPVDFALFPGAPHGFDMLVPDAPLAKRFLDHQQEALKQVLAR